MSQLTITNLDKIAFLYLQKLGAKLTKTTFTKSLRENSYYPSLYSLSRTFDKFKIDNISVKLDFEKIHEITVPFIASYANSKGHEDFITVLNQGDHFEYSDDGKSKKIISRDDFSKGFRNIVFVAELNEVSGEEEFGNLQMVEKIRKYVKATVIVFTISILITRLIFLGLTVSNLFQLVSVTLICFLGLIASVLLLIFEVDNFNVTIKNICSLGGAKTDCDAVLNSKASRILGVGWSEIGFTFFAGILLLILTPAIPIQIKFEYISLCLTMVILYVPFSLIYQYFIIKQWCPICLLAQLSLLMGAVWSYSYFWAANKVVFHYDSKDFAVILCCFILPSISWFFLKPLLIKAKSADEFNYAHKRILHNPDIFYGLLRQQPKAAEGWDVLTP